MAEDFPQQMLNTGIPAGLLDGKGVPVSPWATTPASQVNDPNVDPRHVLMGQVTRAIPSSLSGPIRSSAREAEKYIGQDFGFLPSSIRDNEDFYAQYQSGMEKIGKGLLKLPLYTVTKLGSGVGFIAGMANPVNWFAEDGYISAVADNSISGFFDSWEQDIKNQWLPTFQEAEDQDKGFFARAATDVDFWTEDFVDGLAFMASAWVPGMALSKVGAGAKAIAGLAKFGSRGLGAVGESVEAVAATTNYFKNAAKYAKTLDKFNAWALATSSEAMFEAKGVKENVLKSLEGLDMPESEKKKIAGDNARNAFLMNAALLGATNVFELSLVSKMLNKTSGVASGITGGAKLGEDVAVKQATTQVGKFLESGFGRFAKDATAGVFREGFIEENGQLAIQRFNEQYGAAGKVADMLDFNTYAELGGNYLKQTYGALSGDDTEAATSIGLGGILGGGMTAIGNARQAPKDKLTTEEAVDYYNKSQESWLKFGNIYQTEQVVTKDASGNDVVTEKIKLDQNNQPMMDQQKLAGIASSVRSNAAAIDQTDNDTNMTRRNLVRDNAFADFVLAHVNANMEDTLLEKLDAIANSSPEELAKLGFVADKTLPEQIARYKSLASTIIKQNKIINADIIFDGSKEDAARKSRLTQLAAQQAVYKGLAAEEQVKYNEIRNQAVSSENSSLSDGLVEQLNGIKLRITSQEQFIKELKAQPNNLTKSQIKVAQDLLDNLKEQLASLEKTNELSVKNLKTFNNGLYQFEKDARNEVAYLIPMLKRMKYKGELDNHVETLGKEWGYYADFNDGKKNFLDMFIEQQIQGPVNSIIEAENNQPQLPPAAPASPQGPATPPPGPSAGPQPGGAAQTQPAPTQQQTYDDLEKFLQAEYDMVKQALEAQGKPVPSYTDWKRTAGIEATKRFMAKKGQQQQGAQQQPAAAPALTEMEKAEERLRQIWNAIGNGPGRNAIEDGWTESFGLLGDTLSVGGDNLQAHGMGKSGFAYAIKDLFDLFKKGIDPNRGGGRLYTAPLAVSKENKAAASATGTSGGTAYADGSFMLVAKKGILGISTVNDIGGILVNSGLTDINPEILTELRKAFPGLVIESYKGAKELVQKLNNNTSTAPTQTAPVVTDVEEPAEQTTKEEQQAPASTLEKELNDLANQLRNDVGIRTELRFMKAGSIGYDKDGNKYQVVSKKDKYGRSLEYRKNDGQEQSFNPKTASEQSGSLDYYPEGFVNLYSKNPKATFDKYEKDKAAIEEKYRQIEAAKAQAEQSQSQADQTDPEEENTSKDVKDFVQDINKNRTQSNQNNAFANAEYQEGFRQVAPSNSLANTTDLVNVVEFAANQIRYERGDVNKNYVFDVATSTFMPGQKVTYKVMVDGFEPVVNRLTGEMYDKSALYNENWNAVQSMFDFIPIGVFANIRGKEVMIGTIHEPQWIEYKIGNKYPHIAVPQDQIDQAVPDVVKEQVQKNRELRKFILENYNQNHNFVIEGVVEDKSMGILRTTESVDPISKRVNPKIAEGGTDNRHGMFGIVKDGMIQSDRNVEIDNIIPTESFSPQNIANYQGMAVLMLPTPLGKWFPSFIQLPNVSTEQSEFIIEAWKAFTKQTSNPEIVKAVYDAMGLTQSADSFAVGVLRDYIHHYITIVDEKGISRTGTGSELSPGSARINITNKGGLELQVKGLDRSWYTTAEPIMKAENLPVDYLQKMSNLKTTIRFENAKNDSLKGINSTDKATILSIKNGKLVKENITYNQYIMDRAGTFVDNGIPSKNAFGDWVYFANPVVKMKVTNVRVPIEEKTNVKQEVTPIPTVEQVNAPREDKGAALLAALKAKKLKDQQIEEQKNNCLGS